MLSLGTFSLRRLLPSRNRRAPSFHPSLQKVVDFFHRIDIREKVVVGHFEDAHKVELLEIADVNQAAFDLRELAAISSGAEKLHPSPDRLRDRSEPRHQIRKNIRQDGLIAIAFGKLRRIVHFDHDGVCSGGNSRQRHLWHEVSKANSVRRINDDREVGFRFQDVNRHQRFANR